MSLARKADVLTGWLRDLNEVSFSGNDRCITESVLVEIHFEFLEGFWVFSISQDLKLAMIAEAVHLKLGLKKEPKH